MKNAEEVNYWMTSKTSPDRWMEKARGEIERIGGTVQAEGFGHELASGRAAYMIRFVLPEDGQVFSITWPVLPSKSGKGQAAKIQAATALYHHVKSLCVSAKFLGIRTAFFAHLMLDDGRLASMLNGNELSERIPLMLLGQYGGG